jgi:chromosome segregation ATPase
MGIFDRAPGKKGQEKGSSSSGAANEEAADYYDSPQETVSLSDALKAPAAPAVARGAATARVEEEARPAYGIENAIQLMRALPVDQNVELVVAVIKGTLESLKVKVSDIIEDASRKEKDLENRVSNLKQQISEFEKEIQQRRDEIGRLEADHAETSSVKGRLQLAERSQKAQTPTPPTPTATATAKSA